MEKKNSGVCLGPGPAFVQEAEHFLQWLEDPSMTIRADILKRYESFRSKTQGIADLRKAVDDLKSGKRRLSRFLPLQQFMNGDCLDD